MATDGFIVATVGFVVATDGFVVATVGFVVATDDFVVNTNCCVVATDGFVVNTNCCVVATDVFVAFIVAFDEIAGAGVFVVAAFVFTDNNKTTTIVASCMLYQSEKGTIK